MPIARPEPQAARVIAHLDMDCFYVQVEQRRNPELRGRPTAVVQYNSWRGGGLIAVSYEARKFGVKRSMRGDEAKSVCPDIELVQVPVARGKADLNLYRSAGSEVVSILATKGRCERASIDEVYLDLTDAAEVMLSEAPPEVLETIDEEALRSHVLGLSLDDTGVEEKVKEWLCRIDADHRDRLLACGAIIVAELRNRVLKETQFTCSAGISHNKMLAKLASAMHKPAQQTVVPSSAVEDLLSTFPIKKMKQLGGKLGSSLQDDLGVNTVGDLLKFSKEKLQDLYGFNTGIWLWNIARGVSGDEVVGRLLPKSHGCGKTFPGRQALKTIAAVENWINQLSEELSERIEADLDQNKRVAHTLVLHASAYKANDVDSQRKFPSKSCQLRYGVTKIQEDAMKLFDSGLREFLGSQNSGWGITGLSVSASKILEKPQGTCSILKFLKTKEPSIASDNLDGVLQDNATLPSAETQKVKDEVGYEAISTASDSNYENKPRHTSSMPSRKRKDPGASSILKFFQEKNPSSLAKKHTSDEPTHDLTSVTSNSETAEFSELNKEEQGSFLESGNESSGNHHETRNGYDSWVPCADDIDPSVLAELPEEIQRELRSWMHPNKHPSTSRKGSTIIHYFSPAEKS